MKQISKFCTKLLCGMAVVGLFSSSAMAGHIDGDFGYTGVFNPEDGFGGTTTLGAAVYLNFSPASSSITTATGSFVGITSVNLVDRFISPFVPPQLIWTDVGGSTLSFTLLGSSIDFQNDSFLLISGRGYVEDGVGDRTDYEWTSSYNSVGTTLNFSATQAPIPEPGMLSLLGLSLVGLGVVRRRKRLAKV